MQARNVSDMGAVASGSFFVERDIEAITATMCRTGSYEDTTADEVPHRPVPPFTVIKEKRKGSSEGFFGHDAQGHSYVFKLDDPEYPGLASTTSAVTSRIYWLLGYHVPIDHAVVISGTHNAAYDGRHATASTCIPGDIQGQFSFGWVRHRREFRALRVAAAWLNDTDRIDNNTLVTRHEKKAYFFLIDFDSTLGSWHGRPKERWRGYRYAWDIGWQVVMLGTLGICTPPQAPADAVCSDALGLLVTRFDARAWRPNVPNMAFRYMEDDDAAWMAQRIARISEEQLRAIVATGAYEDPAIRRQLLDYLLARRKVILDAYRSAPPVQTHPSPKRQRREKHSPECAN